MLPPAVGLIFDREGRNEKQREDLKCESGDLVAFTPRRKYENYLLNPRAIAAVASRIEGFRKDDEVSPEEVEEWLEKHGWDSKYFEATVGEGGRNRTFRLVEVDGAKVLRDLFTDLSDTSVAHNKVVHGVALTRWLCDNAPEDLEELARLIEERLEKRERLSEQAAKT